MKIIARVGVVVVALIVSAPLAALGQHAADEYRTINGVKVYGNCIAEFDKYENDPAHRAFAVARNGKYCGWSYEHDTLAGAEARALEECREGGRNCRIIASY